MAMCRIAAGARASGRLGAVTQSKSGWAIITQPIEVDCELQGQRGQVPVHMWMRQREAQYMQICAILITSCLAVFQP